MFVALALAETVLDTLVAAVGSRVHPLFARRLGAYTGHRAEVSGCDCSSGPTGTPETGEAILVPWAYREDCSPIEWTDRLDWIPAGTRGVVTGWLRPRDHWLEGLPTFDIEMAWREPQWTADERRWAGGSGEDALMTPEESPAALCGDADVRADSSTGHPMAQGRTARAWAGAHPSLAARAPAPPLLGHVYRAAEARSLGALAGTGRVARSAGAAAAEQVEGHHGGGAIEPLASAPAVEDPHPFPTMAAARHWSSAGSAPFGVVRGDRHGPSDGIRLLFDPTATTAMSSPP